MTRAATFLSAFLPGLMLSACFFSTGAERGPGEQPPGGQDDARGTGSAPSAEPDGSAPSDAETAGDSGPLPDEGVPAPDLGPDEQHVDGPGTEPTDDRCYSEPVFPDADVSEVLASYGGAGWKEELIEALGRRWPAGAALLEAQRNDSYFEAFSDSSSWTGMVEWLDTLVHEETHLFDAYHAAAEGAFHALFFRGDLIYFLPELEDFPRSEIYSMVEMPSSLYADGYLTGWQGDRGFVALLDELTAYANEMAALSVFGEHYPGHGVSSRDGSVAFLYFLELYLRAARASHPGFYARIQEDPIIREIVSMHWLRTHFFLAISDRFPALGIHDGEYRDLMHAPANVAEIEMFVGRRVGDSSCFLD